MPLAATIAWEVCMNTHNNFWAFVFILIFIVVLVYFGIVFPGTNGLLTK